MVDVEPFPAAAWVREPVEHRGARYPLLEDVVGHVELEPPRGDVEHDEVAILDEGQRPADRCLGRHVEHDRAVGGAAHAAVADAHHVAHSLLEQLAGQRHVRDLRHARVPARPAPAQHEY